jgi:hypothetical protein
MQLHHLCLALLFIFENDLKEQLPNRRLISVIDLVSYLFVRCSFHQDGADNGITVSFLKL